MKQRKAALVLQKHRRGQVARARVRKLKEEKKKREEELRKTEDEEKKVTGEREQVEGSEGAEKNGIESEASDECLNKRKSHCALNPSAGL